MSLKDLTYITIYDTFLKYYKLIPAVISIYDIAQYSIMENKSKHSLILTNTTEEKEGINYRIRYIPKKLQKRDCYLFQITIDETCVERPWLSSIERI